MRWRVSVWDGFGLAKVTVEAPTRAKAITAAAKALDCPRDLVIAVHNLNPASGGGAKRG